MKKPNFLMVGAPKAGTTSIAKYLGEHPQVFMSAEKEPFYFLPDILDKTTQNDPMYNTIARKAHLSAESYYGLFALATEETALGEATVHYLYHYKEVIPKVKKELGDIKIIIILRNPIYRAFSNYKFQINNQLCSFKNALKLEEKRKQERYNSFWFYKEVGLYYQPVKAYLENFSNVYIGFFEDLQADPIQFIQGVYRFLNVEDSFIPAVNIKHNETVIPKNKIARLAFFLNRQYRIGRYFPKLMKNIIKSPRLNHNSLRIEGDLLMELKSFYKPDILKLERLLEKDLSKWY